MNTAKHIQILLLYTLVVLTTSGNCLCKEPNTLETPYKVPQQEQTTPSETHSQAEEGKQPSQQTLSEEKKLSPTNRQIPKRTVKKKKNSKSLKNTLQANTAIINVDCEKLEYFQEEDKFVASGNAKITVSNQDAELLADNVTYYQSGQYITAEGNLKIIKKDQVINGNYAKVDLEEESALISEPNTVISKVKMTADEALLYPDLIELDDGTAVLQQDNLDLTVSSGEYKPEEILTDIPAYRPIIPKNIQNKKPSFKIVAKEIELDRAKTTNNLTIKKASIYIGKFKVTTLPRLTLTVGEQAKAVEAIMPEVGFDKNLAGVYFGPSINLNPTKNSLLRVSPVFSAGGRNHAVGGGGIIRFRSRYNNTDVGYTTTAGRIVLDGEQRIYKDKTKIRYMINEYPDRGFMGIGLYRPLYIVELADERKIGQVLDHSIYSRISGGIARDAFYGVGTYRLQLQGGIVSNKPLLHYKDNVELRLIGQFNLAQYGTSDFYSVVRGGPRVDWYLGRLALTTTYLHSGTWGDTPFIFDEFIRGSSNLIVAGDFRLCKYISVGNIRSMNLLKDGPEPRFSTENQFYARVGPEDIKFRIGYDIVRKRSTFGIDLFMGSGRSGLTFDKLKILHPDVDLQ